ncbi:MAG: magnesium chelatase subunit D [Hydrogenophaga sp.]|uniref:magnesium chelatase subunit D n=1 Tax=Hydrogenophaga sp. TaxID=1904254 RepID=UPI003D0E22EB
MLELAPPALSTDATLTAALCAVDPVGLGGVAIRSHAGPLRDAWLNLLKSLQAEGAPWLRLPHHATDAALLGGLDLAATLQTGRPVAQRGLLARADGGWLVLAMAERCGANVAAHLSAALDHREVRLQRDGLAHTAPARLGLVALDEGQGDDECLPATLLDRLAFHVVLEPANPMDDAPVFTPAEIALARAALPTVQVPDELVQAICGAAMAWGVASLRAPHMAVRALRAAAALAGLSVADETHASIAARLVLAPRATRLPAPAEPQQAPADEQPPPSPENSRTEEDALDRTKDDAPAVPQALEDQLIEAMQAALPPGLLAALQSGEQHQARARAAGTAGALQKHAHRGRPVGTRRGEPRAGARLHLLDTLRAAAPWQRLRQREATPNTRRRIEVRREDFHVVRHRQHRPTTTVFVVDASGSAALHRLAEAKGAVELLLAECYVRRDKVAVLAFRGSGTELLLPPTRSLARAKRALAALPGGGGTPLAQGISTALELAQQIARAGDTPVTVFLTDGRANIDRHGNPGRAQATQDALIAGQAFALTGLQALLIDTSPQPADAARELAHAMCAAYIPLPYAGAAGLSQAVLLAQSTG